MVVDVDFDRPRKGPVCVHAVAGDTLDFHWDEWHNLHELPDYDSFTKCDFAEAVMLAQAKPQKKASSPNKMTLKHG